MTSGTLFALSFKKIFVCYMKTSLTASACFFRVAQSAATCEEQQPKTETADCVVPLCACDYGGNVIPSGDTVREECFTMYVHGTFRHNL